MYISITYSWKWWFEHHVAHEEYSAFKCVDKLMNKYRGKDLIGDDDMSLPKVWENGEDKIKVERKEDDEVIEIE